MIIKRAVDQVDADDAERLLLKDVFFVPHAHVQDNFARWAAGLGLETDAHPAVSLVGAFEITRGNGVGEGEECGAFAALRSEALVEQLILVIEHETETFA